MLKYSHRKTYKDGLTLDQMLGKWGLMNYNKTEWSHILVIEKDKQNYYYYWIKYDSLSENLRKAKQRITTPETFNNYYKLQETPDDVHVETDF